MTGYQPASTYPFAVNILLFMMQIVTVIWGSKISFSSRLIVSFTGMGVYLIAVPFFANVGGSFAYYSVFALCLVYGFFSGVNQVSVY